MQSQAEYVNGTPFGRGKETLTFTWSWPLAHVWKWMLLLYGLFIQTRPHYSDMYVQLGHKHVASLSKYVILDQNQNIKKKN